MIKRHDTKVKILTNILKDSVQVPGDKQNANQKPS